MTLTFRHKEAIFIKMASDNKELPVRLYGMISNIGQTGKDGKSCEMQKQEKMTLNFVQSHQTVFATHAPDIKNMHKNCTSVFQINE